jgi:hypothetical protein
VAAAWSARIVLGSVVGFLSLAAIACEEDEPGSAANPPSPTARTGSPSPEAPAIDLSETRIAYLGSDGSLYAIPHDGGEPVELTQFLATAWRPIAWSPDGLYVAIVTNDSMGQAVFGALEVATGEITTPPVQAIAQSAGHSWAPTGHTMVVEALTPGRGMDVYTWDPATGQLTKLTDNDVHDHSPRWSPDGSKIAFLSCREGCDREQDLWLMNEDGTDQRLVVDSIGDVSEPSWSPDGGLIAYWSSSAPASGGQLRVVAPDGTDDRYLLADMFTRAQYAWAPASTTMAVVATGPGGDSDISLVDAVTGQVTPLVATPAVEHEPAWSPDLRYLAYTVGDPYEGGGPSVHVIDVKDPGDSWLLATGALAPAWSRGPVDLSNARPSPPPITAAHREQAVQGIQMMLYEANTVADQWLYLSGVETDCGEPCLRMTRDDTWRTFADLFGWCEKRVYSYRTPEVYPRVWPRPYLAVDAAFERTCAEFESAMQQRAPASDTAEWREFASELYEKLNGAIEELPGWPDFVPALEAAIADIQ